VFVGTGISTMTFTSLSVLITSAKGSLSDEIIGLVKEPPPLPTPPPCDGDLTYSEVINYKNKRFRGKMDYQQENCGTADPIRLYTYITETSEHACEI
jgi:hypothetical protein